MRSLLLLLGLAAAASAAGTQWALLMAGSSTYANYRHQADIYHAYQLMVQGGIPKDNIIVMHFDDIASSPSNPVKGNVINKPKGPNNYVGVPKDYTGSNVTAANFLRALKGTPIPPQITCPNEGHTAGQTCDQGTTCCCTKKSLFQHKCEQYSCCPSTKTCSSFSKFEATTSCPLANSGFGSGKVIASGPEDVVFVYYSDHGGPGILGLPEDQQGGNAYIHANDIVDALQSKFNSKGFAQLTFYLEACESGSIFDGLLPSNINVYATTASNPTESSWGWYCDDSTGGDDGRGSCLGDLYSIAFLENMDVSDLTAETLLDQYQEVANRTTKSPVMQYGDLSIDSEECSKFEGTGGKNQSSRDTASYTAPASGIPSRDVKLFYLRGQVARARTQEQRSTAAAALQAEIDFRAAIDGRMQTIAERLTAAGHSAATLAAVRSPVTDKWQCYKDAIATFENSCMPMREYGMRHGRFLANVCNVGIDLNEFAKLCASVCA